MSKFLKFTLVAGLTVSATATAVWAGEYGLGRPALPEEVAAWDVKIMPDGRGLPEGSGDVWTGEEVFVEKCAVCHGDFAEGVGNWPKLAGGEGTLADKDPLKTVGSYWPYLSTVWDYVNRSMPFGNAQSLSPDEVYAITAYILYSNFLVDDDFVLSHENFAEVEMPNADGFIVDDRAETEYAIWHGEPCMENCKDGVEITMRAAVLDVTPEEEGAEAEEAAAPAPDAAPDPELVAAGEKVFRQCKACHMVGEGAKNRVGPHLNGVMNRAAGMVDGFRYSSALKDMAADGLVWDEENLAAFLADPRGFMKGTRMGFAGLRSDEDIAAVNAYLSTFGE
ncbi:c-type cytochrome [Roseovarius ramblicola]|uniref:C-type cytochrome n=1 Tax=Roseovarius ramblicola TaxID=2022336 RepID=A0ABV5I058_9RHOB